MTDQQCQGKHSRGRYEAPHTTTSADCSGLRPVTYLPLTRPITAPAGQLTGHRVSRRHRPSLASIGGGRYALASCGPSRPPAVVGRAVLCGCTDTVVTASSAPSEGGEFDVQALDLRGLHALIAVRESGSISAAASALGWSFPTVDHHLRKLERLLASPVVDRTARGTRVTPLGMSVVATGESIVQLCDQIVADARTWRRGQSAVVRFGAFPSFGAAMFPTLHLAINASGTSVEYLLDENSALATRLADGTLDVALVFAAPHFPPDIDCREYTVVGLGSEPAYLAVPDDLFDQFTISPTGEYDLTPLRGQRWILGTANDAFDRATTAFFRNRGMEVDVGARIDDYAAIFTFVQSGSGVAAIPAIVAAQVPIGVHLIELPEIRRDILLAFRPRTRTKHRVTPAEAAQDRVISAVGSAVDDMITRTTDLDHPRIHRRSGAAAGASPHAPPYRV